MQSVDLVKLETTPGILVCNAPHPLVLNGETYSPEGGHLRLEPVQEQLQFSTAAFTITHDAWLRDDETLSPINMQSVVGKRATWIQALLADDGTVDTDNVFARLTGFVDNYARDTVVGEEGSTMQIVLSISTRAGLLRVRTNGQYTSPESRHRHYPGSNTFDLVPLLQGATLEYGQYPAQNWSDKVNQSRIRRNVS